MTPLPSPTVSAFRPLLLARATWLPRTVCAPCARHLAVLCAQPWRRYAEREPVSREVHDYDAHQRRNAGHQGRRHQVRTAHPLCVFAPAVCPRGFHSLQGFPAVCSPAVISLGDFTRFVVAHRAFSPGVFTCCVSFPSHDIPRHGCWLEGAAVRVPRCMPPLRRPRACALACVCVLARTPHAHTLKHPIARPRAPVCLARALPRTHPLQGRAAVLQHAGPAGAGYPFEAHPAVRAPAAGARRGVRPRRDQRLAGACVVAPL
jgi:hypothetical protein